MMYCESFCTLALSDQVQSHSSYPKNGHAGCVPHAVRGSRGRLGQTLTWDEDCLPLSFRNSPSLLTHSSPISFLNQAPMRFSLTLFLTMVALIASFASAIATAEVKNEEAQDTSRNLRVGIINLKAGSRSTEMFVMLDDDSKSAGSDGSTSVLQITQPDAGDSADTEERFVATASWAQALKSFIKNPVQFTKAFVFVRKFFAHAY